MIGSLMPLTMTAGDAELVELYTRYMQSRAMSPATVRRRRSSLGLFARHIAPRSITAATPADIDDWLAVQRTPRTMHSYRSDLSTFFKFATNRDLVQTNPVSRTDAVRTPRALPKPASWESINAAFAVAPGDTQLLLMLGALAGLRIGEIVSLHTDNVHLDARPPVLIVRNGKGGKDRTVPLHPVLVQMLRAASPGYLFPKKDGGHIKAASGGRKIQRLEGWVVGAGFPRFSAHALRHAFGTNMARESGGDIPLVAAMMGHESVNTTMNYVQPYLGAGAEVVSRMGGAIGGGQPQSTEPVVDELAARRRRMA